MTTGKPARCRWTVLAVSLATGCGATVLAAHAPAWAAANGSVLQVSVPVAGGDRGTDNDRADQVLYLQVVLNAVDTGRLAPFVFRNGRLYAEADVLRSLGLTWPGQAGDEAQIALDQLPGLQSDYSAATQRVSIRVPVALLAGQATSLGYAPPAPPTPDPDTRAPGLLLNYDAFAQGDKEFRSLSSWYEMRLFGLGPGLWRSSAVMTTSDGAAVERHRHGVRLDTTWQFDDPDHMVSVFVGDVYNAALDWSRGLRFGGIRISRNFSLQPYRVTVPLASFAGEAVLPSTVDLFVNGVQQSRQDVGPGRFEIDSAPVINGAGNARVVLTDITGQARVVEFPLYSTRELLQAGLSDWSVEVGNVRRDYGLRSLSYADKPMASATLRYGLSNHFTLETHAEGTRGVVMGGLGAAALLGSRGGVLSASYARSRHGNREGAQRGFGYQWQGPRLSFTLADLANERRFRDVASLEGARLPRRTQQGFVGVNIGRGQLGASYVRQDTSERRRARFAGLSWAQSLGAYGDLSLSASHDLEGNTGTSAYLYWSLPLQDQHQAWLSVQHDRDGDTASVGAMRSLPGDADGWGWRAEGSAGQRPGGALELSQLTRYGQWRAGVQYQDGDGGRATGYLDASGGLLLMQGSVFGMRRVYDAFALVSTDGIGGVPVLHENRLVGTTNGKGQLLVTPLNAWQNNDLSIDPLPLSADVEVQRTALKAVPTTGSGVLARFPMQAVVAVELTLRGAGGEPIVAGTPVAVVAADGREVPSAATTVGYDGKVYLQNPPAGARLVVPSQGDGCSANLPAALPQRGWVRLGALPCR